VHAGVVSFSVQMSSNFQTKLAVHIKSRLWNFDKSVKTILVISLIEDIFLSL